MTNDECKNCAVRGNMGQCAATTCSRHESWYAQELRARVAMLEEALKEIGDMHAESHEDAKEMRDIARRALGEK